MRKMSKTDRSIAGVMAIWAATLIVLLFVAFSLKADNDDLRAEVAVLYDRIDYLAGVMEEYQDLSNSIDENLIGVAERHDVDISVLKGRVQYAEGRIRVLVNGKED